MKDLMHSWQVLPPHLHVACLLLNGSFKFACFSLETWHWVAQSRVHFPSSQPGSLKTICSVWNYNICSFFFFFFVSFWPHHYHHPSLKTKGCKCFSFLLVFVCRFSKNILGISIFQVIHYHILHIMLFLKAQPKLLQLLNLSWDVLN